MHAKIMQNCDGAHTIHTFVNYPETALKSFSGHYLRAFPQRSEIGVIELFLSQLLRVPL